MSGAPLLTLITFGPLVGALMIMLFARGDEKASNARWVALWASSFVFLVSLLVWAQFDPTNPGFQMKETYEWFPEFNIAFRLGVDGISIYFILLSTFLTPICILASWTSVDKRVSEYMAAFLALETFMVGMFCALDMIAFYVFFEGVLIPMFLIIGVWGGARRIYASFKFFLYTLLGSVLMLVAIIAMIVQVGGSSIERSDAVRLCPELQIWLWLAFFASFSVKMPMWPVHTWLPDAHVEAPTAGSRDSGWRAVEDGRLRLPPLLTADVPRCVRLFLRHGLRAQHYRYRLHISRGACPGGYEEADCVFIRRPYGLRDAGHLYRQRSGVEGASSRC